MSSVFMLKSSELNAAAVSFQTGETFVSLGSLCGGGDHTHTLCHQVCVCVTPDLTTLFSLETISMTRRGSGSAPITLRQPHGD